MGLVTTKQGQGTTPKRKRRRRPWTERQIDYLKKHVPHSTYTQTKDKGIILRILNIKGDANNQL